MVQTNWDPASSNDIPSSLVENLITVLASRNYLKYALLCINVWCCVIFIVKQNVIVQDCGGL